MPYAVLLWGCYSRLGVFCPLHVCSQNRHQTQLEIKARPDKTIWNTITVLLKSTELPASCWTDGTPQLAPAWLLHSTFPSITLLPERIYPNKWGNLPQMKKEKSMVFLRRKADHIQGLVKWSETILFALPLSWVYRLPQPKKWCLGMLSTNFWVPSGSWNSRGLHRDKPAVRHRCSRGGRPCWDQGEVFHPASSSQTQSTFWTQQLKDRPWKPFKYLERWANDGRDLEKQQALQKISHLVSITQRFPAPMHLCGRVLRVASGSDVGRTGMLGVCENETGVWMTRCEFGGMLLIFSYLSFTSLRFWGPQGHGSKGEDQRLFLPYHQIKVKHMLVWGSPKVFGKYWNDAGFPAQDSVTSIALPGIQLISLYLCIYISFIYQPR